MNICTQEATRQEAQGTIRSQWPPYGSSLVSQDLFPLPGTFSPIYTPNSLPHLLQVFRQNLLTEILFCHVT